MSGLSSRHEAARLPGLRGDPTIQPVTPSIRAFLQVRAASSPQWLDGGARLAFLTGITGIPQAWAVPAAGGWPDQLTFGTERVGSLLATPDGSALAFERDVGGDERHRLHLAEPERALADADAIHRLGCWSPDGTRLAFTHTARNGVDFDLAIVDLASGQRRELAQPGGWSIAADWAEGGSSSCARSPTPTTPSTSWIPTRAPSST